jgi:hypothetical protein
VGRIVDDGLYYHVAETSRTFPFRFADPTYDYYYHHYSSTSPA